jgi:Skp family chaperone for outer membrane proteins
MIETVAKERRYDLVIHLDSVDLASQTTTELLNKIAQRKCLYAAKSIDITNVVLKRVNRRYSQSKE